MTREERKIKNLHDFVKQNYENGHYNQDYSYSGPYSHRGKQNKKHSSDDFEQGRQKYQHDKNNGHVETFYYAPAIRFLNKVSGGKMHEIIDFLDGYQYEQKSRHTND